MRPVTRLLALVIAIATTAAVLVGGSVQTARAGSQDELLLCQNDNLGGWCESRQSYDTNFKNDKMCGRNAKTGAVVDCFSSTPTFNDQLSSVDNNTSSWWKLFSDTQYGGFAICLRPRGYDNNLGNNTDYEDDISSVKKYGTKRPGGCDQVIG